MLDTSTVRVVCAVLAVLFLGIIVLRRKDPIRSRRKKNAE